MELAWRSRMTEKALHYGTTCHHLRVTEMTRGHALLLKEPSTCAQAELTRLGGIQRAPALAPQALTAPVLYFSPAANKTRLPGRKTTSSFLKQPPLIWKSQRDSAIFPGHLHGDALTALRKPGKGVSLLRESTSISPLRLT